MKHIRDNGAASVAELKEFMGELKGKSPEEMLGTLTSSHLVRSTILATLVLGAVLMVFTLGPYLWAKQTDQQSRTEQLTAEREQLQQRLKKLNLLLAPVDRAEGKQPETSEPAKQEVAKQDQPEASANQQDNVKKAAQAMGETGVKEAPSSKNPLEKDIDNLLDDLDP